jgi:hypothetical protein
MPCEEWGNAQGVADASAGRAGFFFGPPALGKGDHLELDLIQLRYTINLACRQIICRVSRQITFSLLDQLNSSRFQADAVV